MWCDSLTFKEIWSKLIKRYYRETQTSKPCCKIRLPTFAKFSSVKNKDREQLSAFSRLLMKLKKQDKQVLESS